MAKREYTYECFVEYSDGRIEKLKELPHEEQERLAALWGQRMADTLADYFSTHPEEYFSRNPQ